MHRPSEKEKETGSRSAEPAQPKNALAKHRGRPFEPRQPGNPKGRPKGARKKRTLLMQELFDEGSEELLAQIKEQAMNTIQRLMGHRHVSATALYCDVSDNMLRCRAGLSCWLQCR